MADQNNGEFYVITAEDINTEIVKDAKLQLGQSVRFIKLKVTAEDFAKNPDFEKRGIEIGTVINIPDFGKTAEKKEIPGYLLALSDLLDKEKLIPKKEEVENKTPPAKKNEEKNIPVEKTAITMDESKFNAMNAAAQNAERLNIAKIHSLDKTATNKTHALIFAADVGSLSFAGKRYDRKSGEIILKKNADFKILLETGSFILKAL